MRITLFIFISILTNGAFGQLKAKLADEHYRKMEYSLCVNMYNELAAKSIKNNSTADSEIEYIRRAAVSNFLLFRMSESCNYFTILKEKNRLTEQDREYFIRALMYSEDYDKAKSIIHESKTLHPKNVYFANLSADEPRFQELFEDSSFYRIADAGFNSGMGDFAPAFSKSGLVYATKSQNTRAIHPSYGWDNDYYINLNEVRFVNDSTFSKPSLLKQNFLSKAHDGPVSFSADGNRMAITKNTIGSKKGKEVVVLSIYFSDLINGEWSDLKPFKYNDPEFNMGHAVFAENDQALYFVSDKEGGYGKTDIYVSRLKNGEWSEPVNLGPSINTSQDELFPFVNGPNLYFASNGHFGLGGLDIFEIDLTKSGTPKNLGYPINSSHDDFGYISDSTTLRGYFSSNRGDNTDRIMRFRKRPVKVGLTGVVYAKYKENEPVPNQTIYIQNKFTKEIDSLVSNEFGQFNSAIKLNEDYRIYTAKEEFVLIQEGFVSTQGIKRDTVFYCELALKPTTIQVHLRVVEQRTGKVIPLATTSVTDYSINKDTTMMTNENGMVTLKVERNKSYWAHAAKKGYTDDNVAFNSANENDKVIDLELRLPPIVKGDRFKLENIFYDLNKSTLRPESKIALDKLADFILKNDLRIELSAHTDARGSDAYNLKLSQARAQSCVDYLISKGVKKSNIIAKGYGETQLLNKCKNNVTCPEDMHQENRRTEVKIL